MSEAILEARGACKAFAVRRLVGWRLQTSSIEAVSKVDLALAAGESVALIGESGCGKSTLARCLVGLLPLDSGRILLRGEALSSLEPEARKR
ncbi:MAG: ATP-binding cassette domain-containing protein, partial [Acidobacteriota bacterium]